ncbi:hypothetical protein BVC93_12245 [Mycobacterium sp. MS1601]|uniref:hypothetical protein n=1 Tax=Mycobacterium sp. MS1601 TaxID=1936029 RepID=UPI0009793E35|nr:hypothetical protein [Mycobacterium sp. MS1601]AQA03076.1 hypothetical protein BVC93_12245 [Mycobacterium sp. MS1601]
MTAPQGRWRHSFEEDHDGITVYRPESYTFPPARGRGGVEFGPDGGFIDWGPGAADVPQGRHGFWSGTPDLEKLEVTVGDRHRVLDVVSYQPDKLELRIHEETP